MREAPEDEFTVVQDFGRRVDVTRQTHDEAVANVRRERVRGRAEPDVQPAVFDIETFRDVLAGHGHVT